MLAVALELLSMLDDETAVIEGGVSVLEEDSATLDSAMVSLEIASELLSIESESVVTLELLSSPHAEIKIADNSKMPELRNVLLEIVFIKNSCV